MDRDSVASVPGASRAGAEKIAGPNGAAAEGSPVMKNAAPLRHMLRWQFGSSSEESGPLDRRVESAMR